MNTIEVADSSLILSFIFPQECYADLEGTTRIGTAKYLMIDPETDISDTYHIVERGTVVQERGKNGVINHLFRQTPEGVSVSYVMYDTKLSEVE